MVIVEVRSPDGWICEIDERGSDMFSPRRWRNGHDGAAEADDPSAGLQAFSFLTARDAMMAAFRERLHRDYLRRNVTPAQLSNGKA